jgi:hypothetical protein
VTGTVADDSPLQRLFPATQSSQLFALYLLMLLILFPGGNSNPAAIARSTRCLRLQTSLMIEIPKTSIPISLCPVVLEIQF